MKYSRRVSPSFSVAIFCCIVLVSGPRALAQHPAANSGSANNAAKPTPEKPSGDKASTDKAGKPSADKAAIEKLSNDKAPQPRSADKQAQAPTDKAPGDKARAENPTADKTATDKANADKARAESSSLDKSATDRATTDRATTDRAITDRATTDRATTDRAITDRARADRSVADKLALDKATADKARAEKPAADRLATDKATIDNPTADKLAADKATADKAHADKPAADRPATDRAAADKATGEKASGETAAGASAAAAASANVEKARLHFQRGIESYRDGDLATALIEFKRAYSTAPNFRLLYNLGQVSADLRDYPAAERYLNQYLDESRNALDEARKLSVQDELAKVRARIAYLHLTSNVEGTEILVDDVLVARAPFQAPIHVSTGRRRVTGRAPGHTPVTQIIDAAGGEDVTVTLRLQPLAASVNDAPAAPPPVYRRGGTRKPLLIGLALGAGVMAAGGVVFGYLAESDAVNYRSALQRKTSSTELKALADGAKTYALVTDFLIGAALLTATVGTVVLMSPDIETREPTTQLKLGLGSVQVTQQF